MVSYGMIFLEKLQDYYGTRLREAHRRGLENPEAPFHWLCRELELRVETVTQVQLFLELIPQYLLCSDAERTMTFAVEYTEIWFTEKVIGPLPHDREGDCGYFSVENPYWLAVQEAEDRIGNETDLKDPAQCRRDISEYVICCLRFYFYLREKQFRSIDRDRFAHVMAGAGFRTECGG